MANIRTRKDWWDCLALTTPKLAVTFYNIYADTGGVRHAALQAALSRKDADIAHGILEHAWNAAPDAAYIHSWPGWEDLCDLCSEFWVFRPEEG